MFSVRSWRKWLTSSYSAICPSAEAGKAGRPHCSHAHHRGEDFEAGPSKRSACTKQSTHTSLQRTHPIQPKTNCKFFPMCRGLNTAVMECESDLIRKLWSDKTVILKSYEEYYKESLSIIVLRSGHGLANVELLTASHSSRYHFRRLLNVHQTLRLSRLSIRNFKCNFTIWWTTRQFRWPYIMKTRNCGYPTQ